MCVCVCVCVCVCMCVCSSLHLTLRQRRLAAKESTALERELVLAETTKLTERARKQVEAGRSDTITVSKVGFRLREGA